VDVNDSEDPDGMRVFYYLVQDLKVCYYHNYSSYSELISIATQVSHLLPNFAPLQNQTNLEGRNYPMKNVTKLYALLPLHFLYFSGMSFA